MPAQSYPGPRSSPSSGEDLYSSIQQLKTGLANIRHTLNNQETEIRMIENKLGNQENAFDYIQEQLKNEIQTRGDALRASQLSLEDKFNSFEQNLRNLEVIARGTVADLRQLSTQANESVVLLGQHKQKISALEKVVEEQNQHMQHFETVIQSMMELIQVKEKVQAGAVKPLIEEAKTYRVQQGDVLGEIARKHHISLQALREANPQVTHDRIAIGQVLTIP